MWRRANQRGVCTMTLELKIDGYVRGGGAFWFFPTGEQRIGFYIIVVWRITAPPRPSIHQICTFTYNRLGKIPIKKGLVSEIENALVRRQSQPLEKHRSLVRLWSGVRSPHTPA